MQITSDYLKQVLQNVESQRSQAQAGLDQAQRDVEHYKALVQATSGAAEVLNSMIQVAENPGPGIVGPNGPVITGPAAPAAATPAPAAPAAATPAPGDEVAVAVLDGAQG